MQDTDAVSCILCLQADEYGSMIKVCVPPGQIPPSMEKVICLRCVAAIAAAARDEIVGDTSGRADVDNNFGPGSGPDHDSGADADTAWDAGLPDRTTESVGESDSYPGENPTGSRTKRSARRVASEKTDD